MKAPALATAIARLTLTKKAANVVIMDLRKVTSMTDFFVVCSADSDTQVRAIANAVMDGTEKKGVSPWHKESGSPNWVLLDYSDVVLHVFQKQARSYYNLEKLWGDAEMKYVDDEKPVPSAACAQIAIRENESENKHIAGEEVTRSKGGLEDPIEVF